MNIRRNRIAIATVALTMTGGCAFAQNAPPAPALPSSPAASTDSRPAPDLRALSDALAALEIQVQNLTAQMADLREQQQESSEEASRLRQELAETRAQLDSKMNGGAAIAASAPATYAAPPSTSPVVSSAPVPQNASIADAPKAQSVEDRITSLEENQQMIDGKLGDQYQTKIESGSKYRVRLSGVVMLNLYTYRGQVDNSDFPALAVPPDPFGSSGAFGGSLRQSRIGFEVFGPDVWGAHTSASIQFDFAGGFSQTENGNVLGIPRLRTGAIHFDWENTSLVAGQDYLFFAPLQPTSLAQFADPPLSYAGNLWAWVPQVRLEHRFMLGNGRKITIAGGIVDSLSGDVPDPGANLSPSWGEQSNQPGYAARIAWTMPLFDKPMTFGTGIYYGRQFWGFGRIVNGWVATADLAMPLGNHFEFSGEFYRGNAVGGFGGAIGQDILLSGNLSDPGTDADGLDSLGGWAQLKYKATKKLEFNAAFGDDNPFAHELRQYSFTTPPTYNSLPTKNIGPFVNFIYQARSNILFSAEYRYLRTYTLDSVYDQASHINLTVAYIF